MRNLFIILFSVSLISCASRTTVQSEREIADAKTNKTPKTYVSHVFLDRL